MIFTSKERKAFKENIAAIRKSGREAKICRNCPISSVNNGTDMSCREYLNNKGFYTVPGECLKRLEYCISLKSKKENKI